MSRDIPTLIGRISVSLDDMTDVLNKMSDQLQYCIENSGTKESESKVGYSQHTIFGKIKQMNQEELSEFLFQIYDMGLNDSGCYNKSNLFQSGWFLKQPAYLLDDEHGVLNVVCGVN